MKKIKVIVTGATGMVGEGVMMECLSNPAVEQVLIINRRPAEVSHPKLKEIVHANMADISSLKDQVKGYDACYFCLGVSSVGMNEEEYTKLTYDLTLGFARTLAEVNPQMTFCYVSGASTDSTEQGRSMWARIKGRTENAIIRLYPNGYAFRPGIMKPTPGQKRVLKLWTWLGWMYPIIKGISPNSACTIQEVGQAMTGVTLNGYEKKVLEVRDILAASK